MERLDLVRDKWRTSLLKTITLLGLVFSHGFATVVTVNVNPGDILDWNDYSYLGEGDTLQLVLSGPGEVQLLSTGLITVLDNIECNSKLRITSSESKINVQGSIKATTEIILEAASINLIGSSLVSTAGNSSGGDIYIGGGWHGDDPNIQNADIVTLSSKSQIVADSVVSGNAGTVVLWSQIATFVEGSISSKALGLTGAGGQVEISSKHFLNFDGSVNVSAQSGDDGEVFFDPVSITIQSANPDIDGNGTNLDMTFVNQLDDATTTPAGFPNAASIITAGAVASLLTNNVSMTLAAQNSITVNAPLSPTGTSVSINFDAPTINLNEPITLPSGGTLSGSGVSTINVGSSGNPQNAIDIADSGTTINLATATYTAPLTIINKNITINGNGIGNTIISGPVGGVPSENSRNPLIYVNGSTNTVIQNLTVNGNNIGFPVNGNITGIYYLNAGGSVTNTNITQIANSAPPYGGGQQGVAIRAEVNSGGPFTFAATNNTIDHFQKAAIVVAGSPITATVSNNTIEGLGVVSEPASIGIQLSAGASGTVTGNSISGLINGDHAQSDGILLFSAGSNILVSGNTVTNNDEGILSLDTGGGLIIQNNNVSDSGDSGIVVLDTAGDSQILSNTLTNNGGPSGPSGMNTSIYVFSSTAQTFEISNNTVTTTGGNIAYFSQGSSAGNAPNASLLSNTFLDP